MRGQHDTRSKEKSSASGGARNGHGMAMALLGHELGNLLNGLMGMAELLQGGSLGREQRQWLGAIRQSGQQMQALIGTFCNAGDGDFSGTPQPRPVDGIDLLEQVVTSYTPAAREGGNLLLLKPAANLPRKWICDPCLLRQLLENLVGNAVKFTCDGEIVLEARCGSGRASGELMLVVRDSGPGIPRHVAERVDQPYRRGSNALNVEGQGLGLFICRKIVRTLGGRMVWSSGAGGTRFSVCLPDAAGPPESPLAGGLPVAFSRLHCHLGLSGELRKSVAALLARLGVGGDAPDGQAASARGSLRAIRISRALSGRAPTAHALRLEPQGPGPLPADRLLHAPLLESTLAAALLEIALEWGQASPGNGSG